MRCAGAALGANSKWKEINDDNKKPENQLNENEKQIQFLQFKILSVCACNVELASQRIYYIYYTI